MEDKGGGTGEKEAEDIVHASWQYGVRLEN